jgi:hypothetical protein
LKAQSHKDHKEGEPVAAGSPSVGLNIMLGRRGDVQAVFSRHRLRTVKTQQFFTGSSEDPEAEKGDPDEDKTDHHNQVHVFFFHGFLLGLRYFSVIVRIFLLLNIRQPASRQQR